MRIVVIGLVFAAVILAGGTAYLLNSYLSSQEAAFASRVPKAPTMSVLVAKSDLPVGTVINDGNTEWMPWPENAGKNIYIIKSKGKNPLDDLVKNKHLTRRAISKGDPITKEKLYKSDTPGFLRGTLSPGMRAVAVRTNPETSSAGFILPGDRVDMMLTHKLVRQAMEGRDAQDLQTINVLDVTSETILEDLRVLAVDQKVSEFEQGAVLAKTVLLEVTPKQAEIITTAKDMGKLSLVLRSAEAGTPRSELPFTTDIEVSPLLSSFDKVSAGENGGNVDYGDDTRPVERRDVVVPPSVSQAPAPSQQKASPTSRKIKVYRGTTTPQGDGAADGQMAEEELQ